MKEARSGASKHIGEKVRDLRHGSSMSRRVLADRAHMDISHLARIEAGQGNPTVFVLIQLATALDVTPDEFVRGLSAADLPADITPYSEADFRRSLRARGRDS